MFSTVLILVCNIIVVRTDKQILVVCRHVSKIRSIFHVSNDFCSDW